MAFTSQVANTPNWWESLARAATAPLFMTGIRMYKKYGKPKENGLTPEQIAQNKQKLTEMQNNSLQTQNYLQQNIPENLRTYQTLWGDKFGADVYNNFYNPSIPKSDEITANYLWNVPQKNENIIDYVNRVNPAWDWRKNLFGDTNFNWR